MPRKKATASKAKKPSPKAVADVRKGKKNGDATKRIRGTLLLQYRAVTAEYNEGYVLSVDCTTRLSAERDKPVYAPLVKLLTEHQHYTELLKAKSVELQKVQLLIAKKLGVTDLKEFFEGHVIDTESGEVRPTRPASS